MKHTRAVIIDDEPKACILLKLLIEEVGMGVDVVETFTDPEKALHSINTVEDLQLIFLDIDMPGMSGFDFMKEINSEDYAVIFVTGYDEYAINAMKIAAAGYVLKPINTEELTQAIEHAKKVIDQKNSKEANDILLQNLSLQNMLLKKVGIPSVMGLDFIKVKDIICCEGVDKYTKVKIEGRKEILSSYNIGEFVKLLADTTFFQTHRSHIINLAKISQYQKDGTIIMEDGSSVPLARRRKDEFLQLVTSLNR